MFFQVKSCGVLPKLLTFLLKYVILFTYHGLITLSLLESIQYLSCRSGETGRRTGFKIQRTLGPCRFESDLRHKAMVYRTIAFHCYTISNI